MTDSTARRQSPTVTCQRDITACEGEFHGICALPAGHAGDCDFVDTMGMCHVNPNCRASRGGMWSDNGYDHNHVDSPFLMYRSTNPASLAPADVFVGYLSEQGMRDQMQKHGLRFSELHEHIKDVKAGYVVTAEDGYEWHLAK